MDIPLLIPLNTKETKLISLISTNFTEETLWINKCEKCGKSNIIHKQLIIFNKLKSILILSIQRFNRLLNNKNNALIIFNE